MDGLWPKAMLEPSPELDGWGLFDAMRFPLSYEGPLPSSGNVGDRKPTRLPDIWNIRNTISPQIEKVFETHPAFFGESSQSMALRHACKQPIRVSEKEFYVIAQLDFKLKCELKITMLVNHSIATVVDNAGDLDNRLKTLLDALRMPQFPHEIKGYMPNIDPYCCLLQNDVLISALHIETFRKTAAPVDAHHNHVRLNIDVHLIPAGWVFLNDPFRQD